MKSSYVCRLRDYSVYTVIQENYRNDETAYDEAALNEIISDELVKFSANSKPSHPIRLVCIPRQLTQDQRPSRKGFLRRGQRWRLRIATNLLDVPADVISLICFQRWAIEIFFRFFKQVLGCRHLISRDQNGTEIQTYLAIILPRASLYKARIKLSQKLALAVGSG